MPRKRIKPSDLPPPCRECRPNDGAWRMSPQGGLERCDCARGRALSGKTKRLNATRSVGHDGKAAATGE